MVLMCSSRLWGWRFLRRVWLGWWWREVATKLQHGKSLVVSREVTYATISSWKSLNPPVRSPASQDTSSLKWDGCRFERTLYRLELLDAKLRTKAGAGSAIVADAPGSVPGLYALSGSRVPVFLQSSAARDVRVIRSARRSRRFQPVIVGPLPILHGMMVVNVFLHCRPSTLMFRGVPCWWLYMITGEGRGICGASLFFDGCNLRLQSLILTHTTFFDQERRLIALTQEGYLFAAVGCAKSHFNVFMLTFTLLQMQRRENDMASYERLQLVWLVSICHWIG